MKFWVLYPDLIPYLDFHHLGMTGFCARPADASIDFYSLLVELKLDTIFYMIVNLECYPLGLPRFILDLLLLSILYILSVAV